MTKSIASFFRFLAASWGASLRSAMEYRLSFVLQAGLMLVNNLLFLAFWSLFFARFREIGGWTLRDQALLYGVTATGFGLTQVFAGGTAELSSRIAGGVLDTWLVRARPALAQAALSRMRLSGFGDMATGPVLLVAAGATDPRSVGAFAVASILVGVAFAALWTLLNCATFWVGNAEDVAMQGTHATLTLALYPESLFGRAARVVLYVVVPAGLLGWLPADLVRHWSWRDAGVLVLGVSALTAAALLAWRAGLRRYEGGNLVQGLLD